MDREALWMIVIRITKESDMTEQLNNKLYTHMISIHFITVRG